MSLKAMRHLFHYWLVQVSLSHVHGLYINWSLYFNLKYRINKKIIEIFYKENCIIYNGKQLILITA